MNKNAEGVCQLHCMLKTTHVAKLHEFLDGSCIFRVCR